MCFCPVLRCPSMPHPNACIIARGCGFQDGARHRRGSECWHRTRWRMAAHTIRIKSPGDTDRRSRTPKRIRAQHGAPNPFVYESERGSIRSDRHRSPLDPTIDMVGQGSSIFVRSVGLHISDLGIARDLLRPIASRTDEVAVFIYLTADEEMLGLRLANGSATGVEVPFRDVVRDVIDFDAHGLIMTHNHPSGHYVPNPYARATR